MGLTEETEEDVCLNPNSGLLLASGVCWWSSVGLAFDDRRLVVCHPASAVDVRLCPLGCRSLVVCDLVALLVVGCRNGYPAGVGSRRQLL